MTDVWLIGMINRLAVCGRRVDGHSWSVLGTVWPCPHRLLSGSPAAVAIPPTHPWSPAPASPRPQFLVDRDGVARKRFKPSFDPAEFEAGACMHEHAAVCECASAAAPRGRVLGARAAAARAAQGCGGAAARLQHPTPARRRPRTRPTRLLARPPPPCPQTCACCWRARSRSRRSASCTRAARSARWTSRLNQRPP